MSRLDELKKQYPELNITVFDMMIRLDTSKSYKYLPLMCKIFGKRYKPAELYQKDEFAQLMLEIQAGLMNKGISTNDLTNNEMYYLLNYVSEHIPIDTFQTLNEFIRYMDKGQIENTDVTSYKDIESIRSALTLASMKELTKDLEGQVIKEFEDEKWVILRPLTFPASAKYGSSTRWCTTYQREKNYFEKYWRKGILVYFINKKTGYKFAGYKGLSGDNEFSFWNSEDNRVDYLDVEADDYLFPIVRKIFKSTSTNKNLSSDEIQEQVHKECIDQYGKIMEIEGPVSMEQPEEPMGYEREISEIMNEIQVEQVYIEREIRDLRPQLTNVPTMRA
jgi:hypothetical protein